MVDSIATMYWSGILLNQDGLLTAAAWKEVDFNEVPLEDFQLAYERLRRALAGAGASEEVLRQLAFDPAKFNGDETKRDRAIRATLRRMGLTLRDQVPKNIFTKAVEQLGGRNGIFQQPPPLFDRAQQAGSPAMPAAPDKTLPTIQALIEKIEREAPKIFRRLIKPVLPTRLPMGLERLAREFYSVDRALSERALTFLIEGLETKSWNLFFQKLENLLFKSERLFTRRHADILEILSRGPLRGEAKVFAQYLLDSLKKRRKDLFPPPK